MIFFFYFRRTGPLGIYLLGQYARPRKEIQKVKYVKELGSARLKESLNIKIQNKI